MSNITDQLAAALREMLKHSGVADAHYQDKSKEDHSAERLARTALAAYDARPAADDGAVERVALRDCPPGPFLYNGFLGFKTEYGSMECENPRDPKTLWRVGHHSDAYVMASGEAFWGGVTKKEDREKILVVPVDAEDLTRAALAAYEARPAASDEQVEQQAERFDRAMQVALVAEALLKGFWFSDEKQAVRAARAALAAYDAQPAAAADANEAELADLALDYLHLAQPEFCSTRCPSVGREGTPIPHLPECVSMKSLLDGLPFATPGATISTGLMSKLKKLAKYLTEKGEYEACDLIDTVVDRLSASPPTPARDEGLEALLAKALRRLAFWAQTSGGTAGRDDGLVAAIDVGLAALRQYDTKLAQEPRP